MTDNSDISDYHDYDWTPYSEYAEERLQKHSQMLEQLEVGGLGPPFFDFPEPPDFFPPPPPIPGNIEECETFSSHFDNCDISKVKLIFKSQTSKIYIKDERLVRGFQCSGSVLVHSNLYL